MQVSMTKIILLSITLLFTPLLNYSVASGIGIPQTSHSKQELLTLSTPYHTMSDMQQNMHDSNNHNMNMDKCNHQMGDQCNISCCGNVVFISATNPVLIKTSLHPTYFSTYKKPAASINLDGQLRPPKSA